MFHPEGPTFFELARQALSSTQRGYDLLSDKFDRTPFRTPRHVLKAVAGVLKPLAPFGDCLDVCCGTGAATEMLLPFCNGKIVGVDFSRGMLDRAKKNLQGVESPELEFHHHNVLHMPYRERFDLAVSFSAFGHILPGQQSDFVDAVSRALKPGGYFMFATHVMPRVWSRDYLFSRSFNAAMRVRNLLIRPPFIMYYLTFLWPHIAPLLERHGLEIVEPAADRQFEPGELVVVVTRKRR